jgi:hypothetical protein
VTGHLSSDTAQAGPDRGPRRYALPAGSGAVWLGLGPAALTGLAVTLLVCVALMLASGPLWAVGLMAATGVAVTAWPVAGRTGVQWVPTLTGQLLRRLLGADRWYHPLPQLCRPTDSPSRPRSVVLLRAPAGRKVQLVSAGEDLALLRNAQRGTATIVLATTPAGRFGLLDPGAQDSELHRWGSSLGGLLSLPSLSHLQWIVHTGPDTAAITSLDDGRFEPGRVGAAGLGDGRLEQDHAALEAAARAQARTHLHLLTVTLAAAGTGRRRADRTDGGDAVAQAAAREAGAALLAADILSYPLTAAELPAVLRQLTDPSHPQPRVGDEPTAAPAVALSGRQGWTHCRLDDTVHRSYAVTGWPRTTLPADWLAGLLHHPTTEDTSRTLVVQSRPVAPEHAARRARATAAKARLDAADRQRLGFVPAAGTALDEVDAEHTAAELVAGYPMADLTALITLHAPDLPTLDAAAAGLRTAAVSQRLDLRPLHGQHFHALAVTLPLGLGIDGQR